MKDLTGQRFGSLVAIHPVKRSPERNIIWKFQCDCGAMYEGAGCWVVQQRKFATNSKAPSCGCLNKETTRELRLTHGMSTHPLFWVWSAMVERCHNPKAAEYHKYGEKGVYVCTEWRTSSSSFFEWALAHGWSKGLHLDKDILCHQQGLAPHYSPETCQFIGVPENCRSTKKWLVKNKPN